MTAARATRVVRRTRAATSEQIAGETDRITYCTVTDTDGTTFATVNFEGLLEPIPVARIYAAAIPTVGTRVAVHVNGGELNIIGASLG